MPTFGFSAFLKFLSLNPRPQRREVRMRLSPGEGGYDFHRSLRLKTNRLMVEGEDLKSLIEEAASLGNPAERRSLEAGLRQLDVWRAANPGQVVARQSALYVSPAGSFKVSFIPDFGYRIGGKSVAIHVWNTGTVGLSPAMTYAALALAASRYDGDHRPDDLAVLSLPEKRLYRLSDVPDQNRLAAIVAANIDRLFETVRDEILAPPVQPGIMPRASDGGAG
jgi:hypothetical protein